METFDAIVIGSGSGLDVANALAESGKRVAVVEKDRMGGTCLNRGCIPSKLLIHSADVAETIRSAHLFGIKVKGFSIDFAAIINRTNRIIDADSDGIKRAFSQIDNPKLFAGEGKFVAAKTVKVGRETIRAEKVLIASGTRPRVPDIPGLKDSGFITSDQALRLSRQPEILTIIGGGFVAAEMVHFYGSLGTKINIIQRRQVLLPDEDFEISQKFTEILSREYNVKVGFEVESVAKKGANFIVKAANAAGKKIELESDQLLVATGRTTNADSLNLAATGVETDERGFIKVDENLETTAKGIFALGDAVGRYLFKHSANHEAQYALHNMFAGKKVPVDYTGMPHAIFGSPQVAGVGYTGQALKTGNIPYQTATYRYINTAMGEAIEDREGFVKLLVSPKGKILGCHIIGSHASILIHEVLVAIRLGASVEEIAKTVHIHPALSEVVSRAAAGL